MTISEYTIPPEFKSELREVKSLDTRSDEEILESLTKHVPITGEKNIWAFWDKGVRNMSGWCQRNIIDWIRLCGPSWQVRILDHVPNSPNNALKWIPASELPESFVENTMTGEYVGQHSADFLRGPALYLYGGAWMDVGNILVRNIDDVCWKLLEDPETPFEVAAPLMYGTITANHFYASRKGNEFIKRWHKVFLSLWSNNRKSYHGISDNPLIAFAKEIKFDEAAAANYKWEFDVPPLTVMEYIGQVMAWCRVCMVQDPHDGFNGPEYWTNNVYTFNCLDEDFPAEAAIGFNGQDLFDALCMKVDVYGNGDGNGGENKGGEKGSEEYKKAYDMVWRILSRATMEKITHGKNLTKGLALGVLWDMEGNRGKDVEPGTFADLLRYGSVHFEQTRKEIEYVKPDWPKYIIKKGLLEG